MANASNTVIRYLSFIKNSIPEAPRASASHAPEFLGPFAFAVYLVESEAIKVSVAWCSVRREFSFNRLDASDTETPLRRTISWCLETGVAGRFNSRNLTWRATPVSKPAVLKRCCFAAVSDRKSPVRRPDEDKTKS